MPDAYWRFLDLWDGDNDSQKLINALDDLERFRPHGPAAKLREANGRFRKHMPLLHALSGSGRVGDGAS